MKNKILYILTLLCIAIIMPMQAQTYTISSVPNVQQADRTHHVSDPAGILSAQAVSKINHAITQLRDTTTAEIAVVLLPSIGNSDIDLFATQLFTHWGIGKADNDNGLLILAVMNQRSVVLRTGYGLEGLLPDIICHRIIDDYIAPAFKQEDYDKGMIDAVNKIHEVLIDPEVRAELMAEEPWLDEEDKAILLGLLYTYIIFSILISLIITIQLDRIIRRYRNTPYEGYKELSSSRTMLEILAIFFPLWNIINYKKCKKAMRDMREKPIACPQCSNTMHRLSEEEDNAYLSPQEDKEEQIGSVDYDVWQCNHCNNIEVYGYEIAATKYSKCPHCHAKTFSLAHNRIILPATTHTPGQGEKIYQCSYCHARQVIPYIIPIIVTGSSSGKGFGGGIGGGFGGGMTGGGGARGGW